MVKMITTDTDPQGLSKSVDFDVGTKEHTEILEKFKKEEVCKKLFDDVEQVG